MSIGRFQQSESTFNHPALSNLLRASKHLLSSFQVPQPDPVISFHSHGCPFPYGTNVYGHVLFSGQCAITQPAEIVEEEEMVLTVCRLTPRWSPAQSHRSCLPAQQTSAHAAARASS